MTDKENSRIGANFSASAGIGGGIGYGQTQMSTSFSGTTQSNTLIPGLTSNQVGVKNFNLLVDATNETKGLYYKLACL
jgi:hypothetical protein